MAANTESEKAAAMWTWSAVAAGVVASLISQALLTMLGLGVGLLAVDLPTANAAPVAISTAALLWWIFSGIFSAFLGGAVAGAYAPVRSDRARTVHAFAAWAIATLIVLGVSALSTSAVTAAMAGPGYNVATRVAAVNRPGTPQLSPQQVEQIRKAFAGTMLASVVGLLAGAVAAGAGGWYGRDIAEEMGVPAGRPA